MNILIKVLIEIANISIYVLMSFFFVYDITYIIRSLIVNPNNYPKEQVVAASIMLGLIIWRIIFDIKHKEDSNG